MALLLIVALSAGFFAGLKITRDAMVNTADIFFEETSFYDFRVFSTVGFTDKEVDAVKNIADVKNAEGSKSADVMMNHKDSAVAIKVMAMPKEINLPVVSHGRLPKSDNECVADNERFFESDIGTVISIAEGSPNSDTLAEKEYTIVGLVDSPLYISIDRGNTSVGSGSLYSFVYIPSSGFVGDIYTELSVTLDAPGAIYTEEYEDYIESKRESFTAEVEKIVDSRAEDLVFEIRSTMSGMPSNLVDALLSKMQSPETYILTRNENSGYVSFENDTTIVSGVANIFPVFFILIALLVCITTMTRMVDEERTQIGTLKAMGYSDRAIVLKYMLYSGSATVIGWAVGFFICTWGLPEIFWYAYGVLYGFTHLRYLFSVPLAVITLLVSLAGILGSTYFSCRKELHDVPASLIRPRADKKGKRILLERIKPFWKSLSFLQKIVLRNMFRYKQRMFMMLLGISWCAGLLVTGFGVKDSISGIAQTQFDNIQKYEIEASFDESLTNSVEDGLENMEDIKGFITVSTTRVDVVGENAMNLVNLVSFKNGEDISEYWEFASEGEKLPFPQKGEALINNRMADKLSLSVGDTLELRDSDMKVFKVKIAGIFKNHIYNYVIISEDTRKEAFGAFSPNSVLIRTDNDTDEFAASLMETEGIESVSRLSASRENVEDALGCLDYIVLVVVVFSGALAFVVIFNLTNINIAERSREIATVQVLGFYPKETSSYVLRENIVLAVVSAIIGMPMGILFHKAVMGMILIDAFAFDTVIKPLSFVFGFVLTIVFAFIVDLFMKRRIDRIKMAESLKAVE